MWKHHISQYTLEDDLNIRPIYYYYLKRKFTWIQKVLAMDNERLPKKFISSWAATGKRKIGRPYLNYGQTLDRDLLKFNLKTNKIPAKFRNSK
jgi:hypothetical protein